ncbi:MAG TPA: hypothetical protein VFC29_13905 [Candidatus Limnocylindrales bacterium]|nr:hypothetical protein [Candidatus Limnocylindrales bacterium]
MVTGLLDHAHRRTVWRPLGGESDFDVVVNRYELERVSPLGTDPGAYRFVDTFVMDSRNLNFERMTILS